MFPSPHDVTFDDFPLEDTPRPGKFPALNSADDAEFPGTVAVSALFPGTGAVDETFPVFPLKVFWSEAPVSSEGTAGSSEVFYPAYWAEVVAEGIVGVDVLGVTFGTASVTSEGTPFLGVVEWVDASAASEGTAGASVVGTAQANAAIEVLSVGVAGTVVEVLAVAVGIADITSTGDATVVVEAEALASVVASVTGDGVAGATAVGVNDVMHYRDDFLTDSATTWGTTNWTVTSGSTPRVQNGVAVMGSLSSNSAGSTYSRFNHLPTTNDVRVVIRPVKPPQQRQANDNELIISLRSTFANTFGNGTLTGQNGIWFALYPGSCTIATYINGVLTSRATGGAVVDGHEIELTAQSNVYTIRDRTTGTVLCTWTDTAQVFPIGSDQKYMHMYQEGNYPVFQAAYGSYGADWIEYGDVAAFP